MNMRLAAALALTVTSQVQSASGERVVQKTSKPLISTDLVSGTTEFLYEAGSAAWKSSGVDKLLAQVPVADLKKQVQPHVDQVTTLVDQHLKQHTGRTLDAVLKEAQTARVQAQAAAVQVFDQIYEPANKAAVHAIVTLEAALPSFKGQIGKSIGNLILFVLYLSFVLDVAFCFVLFVLRLALSIVSCLCCTILCCGCCRSKPAAQTGKPKAAAKKAAAKPAAAKAKQTNGKK